MENHIIEYDHEQFVCPTFTSYTDDKSAETAARVAMSSSPYLDDDDLNFEFDLVQTDFLMDDLSLSEDCHVFPVFNHDDIVANDRFRVDLCRLDGGDLSTSDGEEMYCVWRPRKQQAVEASPARCKKSQSSGAGSKRWKLLDFLKRSNSEGKGDFVFLTRKGKAKTKVSAVEEFYVKSRDLKEGQKRKSYLPYKKDLVGFFVKEMGRS